MISAMQALNEVEMDPRDHNLIQHYQHGWTSNPFSLTPTALCSTSDSSELIILSTYQCWIRCQVGEIPHSKQTQHLHWRALCRIQSIFQTLHQERRWPIVCGNEIVECTWVVEAYFRGSYERQLQDCQERRSVWAELEQSLAQGLGQNSQGMDRI